MSSVYLFASGKGGVGKSTVTANLAAVLARAGRKVVLIDADIGLRSQDSFLGLEDRVVYDLVDVARGRCLLSQALLPHPDMPALRMLPAAQFSRARDLDPKKLHKIIGLLRRDYDIILIDCPAGIERGLRNVLNAGADETVLIVTADDLCLRDAEKTCALISEKKLPKPWLIVNRLRNDMIHDGLMYSARTAADVLDLPLLGEIPEDEAVTVAQLKHALFIDFACESREALIRIAGRMGGASVPFPSYGTRKTSFFRRHFPQKVKESLLRDIHLAPAVTRSSPDPKSKSPSETAESTEVDAE